MTDADGDIPVGARAHNSGAWREVQGRHARQAPAQWVRRSLSWMEKIEPVSWQDYLKDK